MEFLRNLGGMVAKPVSFLFGGRKRALASEEELEKTQQGVLEAEEEAPITEPPAKRAKLEEQEPSMVNETTFAEQDEGDDEVESASTDKVGLESAEELHESEDDLGLGLGDDDDDEQETLEEKNLIAEEEAVDATLVIDDEPAACESEQQADDDSAASVGVVEKVEDDVAAESAVEEGSAEEADDTRLEESVASAEQEQPEVVREEEADFEEDEVVQEDTTPAVASLEEQDYVASSGEEGEAEAEAFAAFQEQTAADQGTLAGEEAYDSYTEDVAQENVDPDTAAEAHGQKSKNAWTGSYPHGNHGGDFSNASFAGGYNGYNYGYNSYQMHYGNQGSNAW